MLGRGLNMIRLWAVQEARWAVVAGANETVLSLVVGVEEY